MSYFRGRSLGECVSSFSSIKKAHLKEGSRSVKTEITAETQCCSLNALLYNLRETFTYDSYGQNNCSPYLKMTSLGII